jgi:hypothetical protein
MAKIEYSMQKYRFQYKKKKLTENINDTNKNKC